MAKLTDIIEYTISIEEEDIPVRGNACATDDKEADKALEDEILKRLERGDLWAWCYVKVEARIKDAPQFDGSDGLGGCSYKDEEDFKRGGYYDDMRIAALDDLVRQLQHAAKTGEEAKALLDRISACED